MSRIRIACTRTLLELNAQAIQEHYSQRLNQTWLSARLDENGQHLLTDGFLVDSVATLMRCIVVMRVTGEEIPVIGFLDVEWSEYNRLPSTYIEPPEPVPADTLTKIDLPTVIQRV